MRSTGTPVTALSPPKYCAISVAREAVDAGGHRGVRGEDRAGADGLQRLVEREALRLDELADALEAEEAGVALVGVEHLGLGGAGDAAERAQRAHAADAEQQLLLQPVLAAAAVQAVGDVALGARRCSSTSESSISSGTRPTSARHTCARSGRPPGRPTSMTTGEPSGSRSSDSGRPSGSSSG